MTVYGVRHVTRYVYEEPVSSSFGEHHLLPRDTPRQVCRHARVEVRPAPRPDDVREREDLWGNRVGHFVLHQPHTELEVVATSVVDVLEQLPLDRGLGGGPPWEDVRDALRGADRTADTFAAREFVLASPKVQPDPELAAYARASFTAGRPVVDALLALTTQIFTDFEFDPTATTVSTPVAEVLDKRAGVCQDFAHLMIGCLRSLGLAARYVSGYLETIPPEGEERLQGADASHAWLSLYVPRLGWVDTDPTNDLLVGDRHLTVAHARDYEDVSPLKGVIFTDGTTDELSVEVDVVALADLAPDDPLAAVFGADG